MKVAIYVVENTEQLVLTPEGDWEERVTREFAVNHERVKIKRGSFYECAGGENGGWYRHSSGDNSLILRLDADKPKGKK